MTIVIDTDIHVYDSGTAFVCTIKENGIVLPLPSSGSYMIGFKKPDKTEIWFTANLFTDGSDGKIRYVVPKGSHFLDKSGTWYITTWHSTDDGNWTSKAKAFKVWSAFET